MKHFTHAGNLHETIWKQFPAIANVREQDIMPLRNPRRAC